MKTYWMFGIKAFINQLSYRSEVWLRLLGNFVTILIQVEIWRAVIGDGSEKGIAVDQMITYSILSTLLYGLLFNGMSEKVDTSLKSGAIASELIKPMSYPAYLFADGLGSAFYRFLFTAAPSLLIVWLCFGILPPASGAYMAAYLISLCIALLISFLLGYLISLIAFWVMNHFALVWMLGGLTTLFSGSFLPLWFFPDSWQAVASALPFQFLGYVPAALYLGTLPMEQAAVLLGKGIIWTAILAVFVKWLWQRAVRRLVVQGG